MITKLQKHSIKFMDKIGKRISNKRKEFGYTQKEFEILCGWSGDGVRICNYENGKREPGIHETKIMSKILQVTPWFLAYGVEEEKDSDVKDFKKELPGNKIPIIPLDQLEDWLAGRLADQNMKRNFMSNIDNISVEGNFCVEILGDAMVSSTNPLDSYVNGELAVVNTDISPREGDVVLFSYENSIKIRKISKDGMETILTAFNSQYPIIKMDDKVKIIGTITNTQRNRYKP